MGHAGSEEGGDAETVKEYQYYIFDIDGTLTRYRESVRQENFLHHNFLFPIFRDMLVERGMASVEAERRIGQVTEQIPFWDYTDFIAEFQLPPRETFRRLWQWHVENIEVYPDAVQLVHDLAAAGKTLLVVSNNPYLGCCWKLKRCGLADEFGSHVFARILGTNILRGCKCEEGVWQRALCQIPDDPARICTVGDNPVEDGEIPQRYGVGNTILFDRKAILRGIDQKKEH